LTADLVLRNAKIYAYGQVIEAGLAVDGDRIVKIAKETNLPSASEEMKLKGLLVLPGLIDAHVHLRDEGQGYKEDFFTGTAAAANGGVTLAIDMPNNRPVTMDIATLRKRMSLAAEKSIVNVALRAAFPERIKEIQGLIQVGAKGFKLFMWQKIGGLDPNDDEALVHAFTETAKFDVPVSVHAEDENLIEKAIKTVKDRQSDGVDAYLKVHSPEAEIKAINRIVEVAEKSNAYTHVCHVSTGVGMEAVSSAKRDGFPVTCEVTPHHLLLSSRHMRDIGGVALTNPPLRSKADISSLWTSLRAGLIDILVSDHAPHSVEEKKKTPIWEIAAGIPGIETLIPLMLTQINEGRLSIPMLVRMSSEKPAEIFRIRDRGSLKEGNFADIVIVDLKKEWRIDSSSFYSKAKYSPFDGWQVKGKPVKTFVNGRLVMEDGEILAKPGEGRVIK